VLSLLLVDVNQRVSVDALESHLWRLRRMLKPDRPRDAR
jgi:hypothetical protein